MCSTGLSAEKVGAMAEEAGMVVIADYGNPVAARLAKARLEAEGIKAFLLNENAISVNPFYSPALGGVKLVVAARDADRARELLGLSGEPPPPGGQSP